MNDKRFRQHLSKGAAVLAAAFLVNLFPYSQKALAYSTSEDISVSYSLENRITVADSDSIFKVPYISTYYFNPKPSVNDTVTIPIYLTDYEQSEYMENDTSVKLDLLYEVDGEFHKIENVSCGDYTLTLGSFSKGIHQFTLQAYDGRTGLYSPKLYNELWVVDPEEYTILEDQTYYMTEEDLSSYDIHNDDSTDPDDLITTREGLTALFEQKQAEGYRKIVLLSGIYRVNGENARKTCIRIPSHFTVDMNGSTFKLDPITVYDETTPGCVVRIEDAIDAHLENGIIEGDRFERQEAGKEYGYIGEPINTVMITGGKYCSINNMTIRATTGHTIFTIGADGQGGTKLTEFSRTAIVNGEETANDNASTSSYIDISGITEWNENAWKSETDPDYWKSIGNSNYMYVGHPEGRRGIKGDSGVIYVSFYDANKSFLETVTSFQFRKIQIPDGAKYCRVTFHGNSFPYTDYVDSVSIYTKHFGDYNAFTNISFEDTRTTCLAPTACSNLLIENCTYTRCGSSITALPVDFEDGWQECQDVYYRNNHFQERVSGNTGAVVDVAGLNHVYENCDDHTIFMRDMVIGGIVKDSTDGKMVLIWNPGDHKRGSYGRIYNNDCEKIEFREADKTHNVLEPVEVKVKNCTVRGNWTQGVKDIVTYENCTFTRFSGATAIFRGCTIELAGQLSTELYFYDCTFRMSQYDTAGKVNFGNYPDTTRVFENCFFEGTMNFTNYQLFSGTFRGCEFEDLRMIASGGDEKRTILFDSCTIRSNGDYFINVGPFQNDPPKYLDLRFTDCDITHTGRNFINLTTKTTGDSQIRFDNCLINKSSGTLLTGYNCYNLGDYEGMVSLDIWFSETAVDPAVTVDTKMIDPSIIRVHLDESVLPIRFAHSCSVGNSLSINYYIPMESVTGYENFRLVLEKQVFDNSASTFTWKEYTLDEYSFSTIDGTRYVRFSFDGIAAKEIGDQVRTTMYLDKNGKTYHSPADEYSVKAYAMNRLEKSSDDTLKTLLVDMLNYGAEAQMYFNYHTEELANKDLTKTQKNLASSMPELSNQEGIVSNSSAKAHFYGKNLVLASSVDIKYYMTFDSGTPSSSVKLVLSYTTVGGVSKEKTIPSSEFIYDTKTSSYTAKLDDIAAKDMSSVVTAKIYDGNTLISDELSYSIETYVYNRMQKSTNEDLKSILKKMFTYGKSAEEYFRTH